MKIAVLFDGAGLARLGLERAGHECTGYEIDPAKHYLSCMVGSGNSVLADVRDVDLSSYEAVWASPPCQSRSDQNHGSAGRKYGDPDGSLLKFALSLPHDVLWVENVYIKQVTAVQNNDWGTPYNAVQFLPMPIQKRRRVIGGRYKPPMVYRHFKPDYREFDVCPAVMASEYKQGGQARNKKKERRKATRWYGRPLSLREMAYHQGLVIPHELLRSWFYPPPFPNPATGRPYSVSQWRAELSMAIGNGVPVYMAQAFGAAYTGYYPAAALQLELFAA